MKEREKLRLADLSSLPASEEELDELSRYLNRQWVGWIPPALVAGWQVNIADGYEEIVLKRGIIDLKKFQATLDRIDALTCRIKVFKGRHILLLFFKGVKDVNRELGETGSITRDSIELSTAVPEDLRLRIIRMLPEHISKEG